MANKFDVKLDLICMDIMQKTMYPCDPCWCLSQLLNEQWEEKNDENYTVQDTGCTQL